MFIADKKNICQKSQRTGNPDTNKKDKEPGFRNGFWHLEVRHGDNERW